MNHTPGPWTVEHVHRHDGLSFDFIVGQRTVAEVGHWKDRDNARADSLLIAAAPDLLEALEYIVAWDGQKWDGEKARDMARAAIAKAKGANMTHIDSNVNTKGAK